MPEETIDMFDVDITTTGQTVRAASSLITQGKWRFWTLTMYSNMLAETCMVVPRNEDPIKGFQRRLERRRAEAIAQYIDSGFGTIPGSIILSAQEDAKFSYNSASKLVSFRKTPHSFLILDGQHRVYGFGLADKHLRVPVVIYSNLTREQECRLFLDINTKQRPVSTELILDIKRLAQDETPTEARKRDVFDLFATEADSPLMGLTSPHERQAGKISRVTFNQALRQIEHTFDIQAPPHQYPILSAYLHACKSRLRSKHAEDSLANPTLFKTLFSLFPAIAERVKLRYGDEYTADHFSEILVPVFNKVRGSALKKPPASVKELLNVFDRAVRSGFSISGNSTAA
jgi:DGQHR domain-containing protein